VTVSLDDELLSRARECSGIEETEVLLRVALEVLVGREAARELASMGGDSPNLKHIARRRI